jgi:hypothetical protein
MNKRRHRFSVYLNDIESEIAKQKAKQYKMQVTALMRRLILAQSLPASVPPLNQTAWIQLSKSSANLNQLAYHANLTGMVSIKEVETELIEFRRALVNAQIPKRHRR